MMKKMFSIVAVGLIFAGVCGCGKGNMAEKTSVLEPELKETIIDYKNASDFVDPIIIEDHKETNGYFYWFYADEFRLLGDNEHFIVAASRAKGETEDEEVICKTDLSGNVVWSCPYAGAGYIYDTKIVNDGVFAIVDAEDKNEIRVVKTTLEGEQLYGCS